MVNLGVWCFWETLGKHSPGHFDPKRIFLSPKMLVNWTNLTHTWYNKLTFFFLFGIFPTLLHLWCLRLKMTALQNIGYKFLAMLHYYQILDSIFCQLVFFKLAQVLCFSLERTDYWACGPQFLIEHCQNYPQIMLYLLSLSMHKLRPIWPNFQK